jgi:4-hydroxy-tetrahydrodipicolinate synthase
VNNIGGIKDSSGDFMAFSQGVHADYPADFAWIQGEDLLDGPSLLIGAQGMVTGLGNVWIEPYIMMYQAARAGDAAEVKRAQQQINALYEIIPAAEGQVIPAIKAGAALLGRSAPTMKLPGLTLRTDQIERVKHVLHNIQLV